MVRKNTLYQMAMAGWMLLSVGASIAIYSGNAEPFVYRSQLPEGPLAFFGVTAGTILAGWLVVSVLKTRSWKTMGRRANLSPDGGGLFTNPDLTGSLHGRPVRVRTVQRRTGSGDGESGSSKTTYTVVETDLEEPADTGVVLVWDRGGSGGKTRFGNTTVQHTAVDDGFAVVGGGSEEFAGKLLTHRARNALLDVEREGLVCAGDAAGAMMDSVPDVSGSLVGKAFEKAAESGFAKMIPGDASTVSIQTRGVILDPDEVESQVEAVVAVADAFEEATATRRVETQ